MCNVSLSTSISICHPSSCHTPRLLLCDLCFFGCSETLTLRQRLATAYRDFRQWCSENKVQCGQPLFREGMVSCLFERPIYKTIYPVNCNLRSHYGQGMEPKLWSLLHGQGLQQQVHSGVAVRLPSHCSEKRSSYQSVCWCMDPIGSGKSQYGLAPP